MKKANNCFNLSIPVVMKIAVATLGNFHAKPFGPELQVKQMLGGRLRRARNINISQKIYQLNIYSLFNGV